MPTVETTCLRKKRDCSLYSHYCDWRCNARKSSDRMNLLSGLHRCRSKSIEFKRDDFFFFFGREISPNRAPRTRKNKYFRENSERKNADIKIHANKLFVHRIESITKVGIKYFPRRNNKKKQGENIACVREFEGDFAVEKTCRTTASFENVIYILFHYLPRIRTQKRKRKKNKISPLPFYPLVSVIHSVYP